MPTPEVTAHRQIDAKLAASGWAAQTFSQMDFSVGTEFPGAHGEPDYLL